MPEANGVYLAAPTIYNSNFQLASQVAFSFENKYDKQLDYNGANSIDLIRMLYGLLDKEEIARKNVKDVLNSGFSYSGLFGVVDVLPREHDISFQLFPAKIVDGELEFRR